MNRETYLNTIFPQIPDRVRQSALVSYPDVRLTPEVGFTPLADVSLVMLVGLTGTGKTTTLNALRDVLAVSSGIPTRRQLADLILIPAAQHHQHESLQPVHDREHRFTYTRIFRDEIASGGTAAAFTWLYYRSPAPLTVSEGVRGTNEIGFALAHTQWRIVELWVDPVVRLRRLSQRGDAFDQTANTATGDLSFLPPERIPQVQQHLADREISPTAIVTARAEAQNYGGQPYDATNTTPNYRCIVVDTLSPAETAAQIVHWLHH